MLTGGKLSFYDHDSDHQAVMSEKNCVCVICNEGTTSSKRLINNPDMVDELVSCCKVRLSLGETGIKQLTDH